MKLNAKQFSLEYIEIVDDVLDAGQVKRNPRAISKVEELSGRLEAHFSVWQRGALESIQNRNDSVAFHFGNSDQLSKTLEYAPLYVDHVVLQDLIFRTLQRRDSPGNKLMRVRPLAEQLLSWKPLVEEGRVSIIPSPLFWDRQIQNHLQSVSPSSHQFAVPLYAALLLKCSPMTDVPTLARRLPEIAKSSVGQKVADISASFEQNPTNRSLDRDNIYYRNLVSNLQDGDVVDVLPLLLGNDRITEQPELWCLKNPDPDQLLELSSDIAGFREELNNTVNQIESSESVPDIFEVLEATSEQVIDEYERIKNERERYRRSLRRDSIKIVLQSVPLVVGLGHHDLLLSLLGTTSTAGLVGTQLQELYEKLNQEYPGENNAIFRTFNHFELN